MNHRRGKSLRAKSCKDHTDLCDFGMYSDMLKCESEKGVKCRHIDRGHMYSRTGRNMTVPR